MTVVSEDRPVKVRRESNEIEQIKRLIEIQTQIVELAKQNELTEKECEALRHELSQSVRRPRRRFDALATFFERLLQRWRKSQS